MTIREYLATIERRLACEVGNLDREMGLADFGRLAMIIPEEGRKAGLGGSSEAPKVGEGSQT